jgi:hypothetical protein
VLAQQRQALPVFVVVDLPARIAFGEQTLGAAPTQRRGCAGAALCDQVAHKHHSGDHGRPKHDHGHGH